MNVPGVKSIANAAPMKGGEYCNILQLKRGEGAVSTGPKAPRTRPMSSLSSQAPTTSFHHLGAALGKTNALK